MNRNSIPQPKNNTHHSANSPKSVRTGKPPRTNCESLAKDVIRTPFSRNFLFSTFPANCFPWNIGFSVLRGDRIKAAVEGKKLSQYTHHCSTAERQEVRSLIVLLGAGVKFASFDWYVEPQQLTKWKTFRDNPSRLDRRRKNVILLLLNRSCSRSD